MSIELAELRDNVRSLQGRVDRLAVERSEDRILRSEDIATIK